MVSSKFFRTAGFYVPFQRLDIIYTDETVRDLPVPIVPIVAERLCFTP